MWLNNVEESLFSRNSRQKVWDAMKGKEPEGKLIDLLPTDKLKNNFQATISCFLEESYTKKSLTREEMHHLLVRKMLELTNRSSEYDVLFFQKVREEKSETVFI